MKKNTRYALFFIILLGFTFSGGYAQTWNITGNNNINPALHFMGTTNNNPVIFKANNLERMRINVGTYRGVDIGTPNLNNELRIFGRDSVGFTIPLHITGNVLGQTWGNTPSQTLGRLVRFNQGPTTLNGGINFFDLGIGEDTSLFITNHTVPPVVGNGFIRKKMIVISPQDHLGIHLDPDVKPTANLHSEGTVRLQNLPAGAPGFQKVVTIDDDGNLAWNDKSELGAGTDWSLTGNAGTDPNVNFVGTTDASPLVFRSEDMERMRINTGIYRGVDVGTPTQNNELRIYGRDSVDYTMPLVISGNVIDQTWGNDPGQTMGRLVRFNQGPTTLNGGINFFDMGIGEDTSLFITNHSVPPTVGNGFIRRKMIVISTEDNVGIHLDPTEKPTANLHSDGTVRFQNLPSGQGNILVIDADGNVFKASSDSSRMASADITALQTEITDLKAQLTSLKEVMNNLKGGFLDISTIKGTGTLNQNTPNPFNKTTRISYYVPGTTRNAVIRIADLSGRQIKSYTVGSGSEQSLTLQAGELLPGTYTYSLVIDGKIIDTKKLVLIR
jgi:hypothetical protein